MKRGNKPYSVTFESLVMRLVKQIRNPKKNKSDFLIVPL